MRALIIEEYSNERLMERPSLDNLKIGKKKRARPAYYDVHGKDKRK